MEPETAQNEESDGLLAKTGQIDLPSTVVADISKWLQADLNKAKGEWSAFSSKIVDWIRLYEAEPEQETKSFPYEGASNLVVPAIATAVEAVFPRLVASIFGTRDIWSCSAKAPGSEWDAAVEPLNRLLNWTAREKLHLREVGGTWLLAGTKYGTGIIELVWEERYKRAVYMEQGSVVSETLPFHIGPKVFHIPIADFLTSNDAISSLDLQNCQWVAHRVIRTWKQIKELEINKYYFQVDRIKSQTRTQRTDQEIEIQSITGVEQADLTDYEIWEIWASYDVDNDKIPEEIVVDMTSDGTVLRAVYNPYRHQERPFHLFRYFPRDNHILGVGLCEMLQFVQDEQTTTHNQRIDNGTIANSKVFKKLEGSTLTSPSIYPGAILPVKDMKDIEVMDLGVTHPSQLQEELHTETIGEKRTGVSSYTVGRESEAIGSRATATSTMALIGEGNKRFQLILSEIRVALTNLAYQIIMLYQQYGLDDTAASILFTPTERAAIDKVLKLPATISRERIVIDMPAIDELHNRDMLKQTSMTLLQGTNQFYQSLMQGAAIVSGMTPVPDPVRQLAFFGMRSGARLWKKVLEAFEITDIDSHVPDIDKVFGGIANGITGVGGGVQGQPPMGPGPGTVEGGMAGPGAGIPPGQGGAPMGEGLPPSVGMG